jgi:hypothetical protein
MSRFASLCLRPLMLGVALEAPFALWGYSSPTGHGSLGSGTLILAALHAPCILLLTVLLKPFSSRPDDVTFPMTATFAMQAVLLSLVIGAVLVVRERRAAREAARTASPSNDDRRPGRPIASPAFVPPQAHFTFPK